MARDITYVGEGLIPPPLSGPALRYTPLAKGAVTAIAVHHWTGWLPPATWTADEEIAYIIRIDEYHKHGRGLDAIGYQLAQFPSGRVYIVSRLDRYGAGVGGHNNHVINISLPGTFHISLPSPQHLAATVEAVRYVYDYLGRDVPTTPHLAWGGTNCPGDRWKEWVPQLRALAIEEDNDMALTLEQRVAAHEQYHKQLDALHTNYDDRIKQLKIAEESLLEHIAKLQVGVAALKARPAGSGLKRGDTVKLT